MNYIVWTEDYSGSWKKAECGDKLAAERAILEAIKEGKTPLLTIEVPYSFNVKMAEPKEYVELTPKKPETKPPETKPEEVKSEAGKNKA